MVRNIQERQWRYCCERAHEEQRSDPILIPVGTCVAYELHMSNLLNIRFAAFSVLQHTA